MAGWLAVGRGPRRGGGLEGHPKRSGLEEFGGFSRLCGRRESLSASDLLYLGSVLGPCNVLSSSSILETYAHVAPKSWFHDCARVGGAMGRSSDDRRERLVRSTLRQGPTCSISCRSCVQWVSTGSFMEFIFHYVFTFPPQHEECESMGLNIARKCFGGRTRFVGSFLSYAFDIRIGV